MAMSKENTLQVALLTGLTALGVVGLTWLLHFPWEGFVFAMVMVQGLLWLLVNMAEAGGAKTGGSGWLTLGFFFLQALIAITLLLLRLVLLFMLG